VTFSSVAFRTDFMTSRNLLAIGSALLAHRDSRHRRSDGDPHVLAAMEAAASGCGRNPTCPHCEHCRSPEAEKARESAPNMKVPGGFPV
jgi:hypothetical protein